MNAKQKFEDQRTEFHQKGKNTTNAQLDYLHEQIHNLFDYINELETAVIERLPKRTALQLVGAAKMRLRSELCVIGLPLHYAAVDILYSFINNVVCGNIKIDDSTKMEEVYAMISPIGGVSPAAYAKRALTTMRKKADFTNAKIFKGITKGSTNDDVLKALYACIILIKEKDETLV